MEKSTLPSYTIVLLKLVASCCWNCSLDEILTIINVKPLRVQIHMKLLETFIIKAINFIRASFRSLILSL